MTSQTIMRIEQQMLAYLDNSQMKQLHAVLTACIQGPCPQPETDHIQLFLAAKRVEGCSEKTIRYYDSTLRNVLNTIGKDVLQISTDDLRLYLDDYQSSRAASKTTIDNIRRILSSFFAWLEDEDYILKSPVRRIHKVKTCKTVKETYSDEALEIMRDHCENSRDLALIDLLASTGMRVGELVLLNREDIDFTNRECVVLGKGNKQRKVYFDARAKIHLQNYLHERTDNNPALFVSLQKPHNRLQIRGMEMFDFTYQLFQTWGIGGKGKNTGVLVCFVLDSHDIRIMTGTGIEGVLPDAVCNRIIQDEMIPLFREEKYGKGLCYGAMRIYEVCTDGEAPEELRNMQSVTDRAGYGKRTEDDWAGIIPLIVLCFGGLGLFVWAVVRGQYRRCPKCGKRKSRVVREQVVAPATYAKAGTGVRTYVCKNCGHSHTMPFTIPRRQRTVYIGGVNRGGRMGGGGGFSGGGSWGGGSTFGGGAGGKW